LQYLVHRRKPESTSVLQARQRHRAYSEIFWACDSRYRGASSLAARRRSDWKAKRVTTIGGAVAQVSPQVVTAFADPRKQPAYASPYGLAARALDAAGLLGRATERIRFSRQRGFHTFDVAMYLVCLFLTKAAGAHRPGTTARPAGQPGGHPLPSPHQQS
jgi:hypothetical protein